MPDFDVTPQAFWWNSDLDLATLKQDLQNNNGRLVSLDVFVRDGQLRFCGAWVSNDGDAAASGDWDPDIDPGALRSKMDAQSCRITCLSSYVVNGTRHYAAVWVKNTGAHHKTWWWHHDLDPDAIGRALDTNNGRLVAIDTWIANDKPRCAAVWIANAGADAAGSWWHPGVDANTLAQFLDDNTGRIVCLDAYTVGDEVRYAAAWIRNDGALDRAWFWWPGVDTAFLGQQFDLFCCYPIELRSFDHGSGRQIVGVVYGYPQAGDPALLSAQHAATLTTVGVEDASGLLQPTSDPAPLHQWMDVDFTLKNDSAAPATVTLAELYPTESGGFIYPDGQPENALTGLFAGASATLAPGASLHGTGTREMGFGIAHYMLRWRATHGGQTQNGVATTNVPRTGFDAPPTLLPPSPALITLWTDPAEVVSLWVAGRHTTWLSVGGQILNVSGKTLRIAGFWITVAVDGKRLVDEAFAPELRHWTPNSQDPHRILDVLATPAEGVRALPDYATYFVHGFDLPTFPATFEKASLKVVLNYKIGGRCGSAVYNAAIVRLTPMVVRPPLQGTWNFGSSPDHSGFDAHAWPAQRFAIDFTRLGPDGNSFADATKLNQNGNFFAYRKPISAIAGGDVVAVVDANPENHGRTMLDNPQVNYIVIHHRDGANSFYHGYYHIHTGSAAVAIAQHVNAGDPIAEIGNAGGSSEPHLHLGAVRTDATGRGTMIPLAFTGLTSDTGQAVDGNRVPATANYASGS